MKKINALAFKIPLVLGLTLTFGGCYTMLKHPAGEDLTAGHGVDYRYSDCASCHYDGFDQPLFPYPYDYTSGWFEGYYGCPWWLPDCGYGYGYAPGGGYGGGGAVRDGEVGPDDGRNIGGRGAVRGGTGVPRALPSVAPPGGGTPAGPTVRPNEAAPSDSGDKPGQQPGRTLKRDENKSSPSSPSKDPGKKNEPPKDPPKQ